MSEDKSKVMAILKATDLFHYIYGISAMTYFVDKNTSDEYVRAFMPDGSQFDIDVTADSLSAMLADCVKGCNRRLS